MDVSGTHSTEPAEIIGIVIPAQAGGAFQQPDGWSSILIVAGCLDKVLPVGLTLRLDQNGSQLSL
jgi:hypothetical protein